MGICICRLLVSVACALTSMQLLGPSVHISSIDTDLALIRFVQS